MNKIITMTISVVIAVVMISVVVLPIIETGSYNRTDTTVLTNEGTSLIKGDVADDYNIQWDSALPGMVKVNGNVTTVYFVAGDDATVSPESKTVTVDLTYGELPTPTREGYVFDGWFTSTQYTTEITEDTIVVGTQDKILYAKWLGAPYTITFDANGGTVDPSTKTVNFGSPYGELPVPEYTGHIFGGWFDEDDNVITSTNIVNVADDQTLTARWTLENYTISFTTDGNGTVDVQSLTADYGTAYTISSNTVTIGSTTVTATPNSMYVFDSWTPGTSGTVSGSMTFMANFNLPPVTISFTAESPGSVSSASISDVPRGTQYVVADNVVTITGFSPVTASLPDGYYMTGWNIAQGVGTITDAMTFTAEYEVIEIAMASVSNDTIWIVTTDGKLFGCGKNTLSQQGDGTTTNVTTFTQRLENETIASVSCITNATWALTTDGKLFGCGSNSKGQQGNGTNTNVSTFTQRLSTETIASVSCSTDTTWALTTDGKLFGCGNGLTGQQGNGTTTDVKTFTQRLSTETIAEIYCSENTTWAITTDGKLFGCGKNNFGQQGDGTTTDVNTFTQRLSTETIADVSCTYNSTWALTTDGKLFGTGYNSNGEQGAGNGANVLTFTQRLDTETIASVSGGFYTTWVVTTDGKLFGCGDAQYGQQGYGNTTDVNTFTQRLSTETIANVISTPYTTWVVTTDGKLFGCGDGSNGQQGSGTTNNVNTFTQRLDTETIVNVNCSLNSTWAITTDGKLFGCGKNDVGQQGDGTTTNVTTFTQRGPPGSVNIATQIQQLSPQVINPINLNPLHPITPTLNLMSVTPSDIISTDYTFHAGGEDWMLCTVSTGVDQYALALYYAGLTEPLMWDEDVTLTFSNGTLTVTNNGQTYTMEYDSIFYKGNGKYVLMGESAYVKNDSQIIGFAMPTTDSAIEVTGTVSSVEALSIADGTITTVDSGSVESAISDYENVFQVSKVSATYDTDQTVDCDSIIVPKNVTISTTVDDDTVKNILSIIPVFMIIGVLVAIVSMLAVKSRY